MNNKGGGLEGEGGMGRQHFHLASFYICHKSDSQSSHITLSGGSLPISFCICFSFSASIFISMRCLHLRPPHRHYVCHLPVDSCFLIEFVTKPAAFPLQRLNIRQSDKTNDVGNESSHGEITYKVTCS